jgi:hypothetical protein
MRSENNAPKIGKPTVGFTFTTMLEYTSRFRSKNNVITLDHSPYHPDLAPADFYLFPPLKSALKGRHYCDASGIIKIATDEAFTRRLPGMFPAPLHSLSKVYSRTGGQLWRKCSLNYCTVLYFS